MRRNSFLLLTCLIISLNGHAQLTFQKTFGDTMDNSGFSIAKTTDGGYIIAGKTTSAFGDDDVYLLRIDSIGNILWSKAYGGSYNESGAKVKPTFDNGYIIAGKTYFGNRHIYLIKTDSVGDTLWTKFYKGEIAGFGNILEQTSDSGYVIIGYTLDFGTGGYDAYLIKTNKNGDTLWTKTYGVGNVDWGLSIRSTSSGFVIVGESNYDLYLIRTDNNGNVLWSKTYGGTERHIGADVQQTSDSGFIITGSIKAPWPSTNEIILLIRVDSIGDTLWAKNYGLGRAYSVLNTSDGGFLISAYRKSVFGYSDGYLIKTDSNGNFMWAKRYGGENYDYSFQALTTSDKGYVVIGSTSSFSGGDFDVYLIKTDSNGYSGCNDSSMNLVPSNPLVTIDTPATMIGSGGILNTYNMLVNNIFTTETDPCDTTASLTNLMQKYKITITPNPFSSSTVITLHPVMLNASEASFHFQLYDILGRRQDVSLTLNMTKDARVMEIQRGNLPTGLYFFRMTNEKGVIGSGKLVVQD